MALDIDCLFVTLQPNGLQFLLGPFVTIANRDPGENDPHRRRDGCFKNWTALVSHPGVVRVPFGLNFGSHPQAIELDRQNVLLSLQSRDVVIAPSRSNFATGFKNPVVSTQFLSHCLIGNQFETARCGI